MNWARLKLLKSILKNKHYSQMLVNLSACVVASSLVILVILCLKTSASVISISTIEKKAELNPKALDSFVVENKNDDFERHIIYKRSTPSHSGDQFTNNIATEMMTTKDVEIEPIFEAIKSESLPTQTATTTATLLSNEVESSTSFDDSFSSVYNDVHTTDRIKTTSEELNLNIENVLNEYINKDTEKSPVTFAAIRTSSSPIVHEMQNDVLEDVTDSLAIFLPQTEATLEITSYQIPEEGQLITTESPTITVKAVEIIPERFWTPEKIFSSTIKIFETGKNIEPTMNSNGKNDGLSQKDSHATTTEKQLVEKNIVEAVKDKPLYPSPVQDEQKDTATTTQFPPNQIKGRFYKQLPYLLAFHSQYRPSKPKPIVEIIRWTHPRRQNKLTRNTKRDLNSMATLEQVPGNQLYETEEEKEERFNRAMERLAQVINIFGQMDNFFSTRFKNSIRKLAKICEEEGPLI